jgi:hypothetical protein
MFRPSKKYPSRDSVPFKEKRRQTMLHLPLPIPGKIWFLVYSTNYMRIEMFIFLSTEKRLLILTMKTPIARSTVPSTTGIILYAYIVTHSLLSSLQKNDIKYERWQNVCFPRERGDWCESFRKISTL